MQTITSCYGLTVNFNNNDTLGYESVKTSCENLMKEAEKIFKNLENSNEEHILIPVKLNTSDNKNNYQLVVCYEKNSLSLRIFANDRFYDNIDISDLSSDDIETASNALVFRCEKFVNSINLGRSYPKLNMLENAWKKELEYSYER